MNNLKSYTSLEIFGQPTLWWDVYQLMMERKEGIEDFLEPILQKENVEIILTGAGSSAFIGEAAQGLVQKNLGRLTKAIATTDIVTHPELNFRKEVPTLLISFARSGNSPESIEAVKLANDCCREVYHLIISCNQEGELVKDLSEYKENAYVFLLPEAAHDKSLAMTGSFTSMLLSILLISRIREIQTMRPEIQKIISQGKILLQNAESFGKIAEKDFQRVVFLGSGPMLGVARECHLKLQELTDGQIICKHDSFLGFRHGPRAVTDKKTLLVYLFSANNFVYQYELDLALSIEEDPNKMSCLAIGRPENPSLETCLNIDLDYNCDQQLNIVPAGLVGQLLGLYKSLNFGLNPDKPSISGAINRVVQGVNIYSR